MHKAIAAGVAAALASVALGVPAQAEVLGVPAQGDDIGPLPGQDGVDQGGQLDVFITNQTSSTINVNWLAQNSGSCAGNTWMYYNTAWDAPGNHTIPETEYPAVSDGSATVAPGATGWISAWSSTSGCSSNPQTSMGTWLIGLVGAAQFEFGANYVKGGTSPADYTWTQSYTGGGNTGGMYMYNCGDGTLMGGGKGSQGANYTYSYGSNVCLVVQDGGFNSQQALAAGAASNS